MTLEEMSAKTKIPRSSLEALEEERWSALPGPVFVKGFLRCCARALEIDDQIVLDLLYEQERAKMHAEREPDPEPAPAIGRGVAARTFRAEGLGEIANRKGALVHDDDPSRDGREDREDREDRDHPATNRALDRGGPEPTPLAFFLRGVAERAARLGSKLAARLPGANLFLWVAVALLVLGLAFAVLMAFGAQQALTSQS